MQGTALCLVSLPDWNQASWPAIADILCCIISAMTRRSGRCARWPIRKRAKLRHPAANVATTKLHRTLCHYTLQCFICTVQPPQPPPALLQQSVGRAFTPNHAHATFRLPIMAPTPLHGTAARPSRLAAGILLLVAIAATAVNASQEPRQLAFTSSNNPSDPSACDDSGSVLGGAAMSAILPPPTTPRHHPNSNTQLSPTLHAACVCRPAARLLLHRRAGPLECL